MLLVFKNVYNVNTKDGHKIILKDNFSKRKIKRQMLFEFKVQKLYFHFCHETTFKKYYKKFIAYLYAKQFEFKSST